MNNRLNRRKLRLEKKAVLCAAVASIAGPVRWANAAQNGVWDGGGGNDNWTTPANWVGDIAPTAGGGLGFAGSSRLNPSNDFSANTAFSALTFSPNAGNFTLTGNALQTSYINDSSTGVQRINLPISSPSQLNVYTTSGGELQIGGTTGRIDTTNSSNVLFGGVGTVTLNGAVPNSYTTQTYVSSGTLNLDFANLSSPTNLISAAGVTIGDVNYGLGSNAALRIEGKATGATSQTFASTTLDAGAFSLSVNSRSGTGTTLNLGALTRNEGATVDVSFPALGAVTTTTANANIAGGQSTILGGYATVGGGTTWAASAGNGVTAGALSGLTTFNTTFAPAADVDVPAGITAPAGVTVNSVRFNVPGATVNTSGDVRLATGGLLVTPAVGAANVSINNNHLTSGNGSDLIVHQYAPSGTLAINSVIANDGPTSIGLTKVGPGTLQLGGANTYSGPTRLLGGTVSINSISDAGVEGGLGASTDRIIFTDGTLRYTGATASSNRDVLILPGSTGAAIDVANPTTNLTLSGTIGSDGVQTLLKKGPGTLTFGGATDNYFMMPDVSEGTLVLAKASVPTLVNGVHAIGGATRVRSGATLRLAGTGGDQIFDYAGPLTIDSGGTFDMNGLSETIPSLSGAGTVTSTTGAGPRTLGFGPAGGGFFVSVVSERFDGTISDGVSGSTAVAKASNTVQVFGGPNSYSGGTTVTQEGALVVANATGSGTGSGPVSVTDAILGGGNASGTVGRIAGPITLNRDAKLSPGMPAVVSCCGTAVTFSTGNATGMLTADSGVTFGTGSAFVIDVNGSSAGTSYDVLRITGQNVSLGSGVAALSIVTTGYTPSANGNLWIIDNTGTGSTTGFFSGLTEGSALTIDGTTFHIFYDADHASGATIGGNDVLLQTSAVPEPSLAAFGLIASVPLMIRRRR